MKYRIERDSMGEVKVREDCLWGAQTQRSLENFRIGDQKMPAEVIRALVQIKKAAACANADLGVLDEEKRDAVVRACDAVLEEGMADQFPLSVWQTGSGTQTNMNVNEVIARVAGGLHPNDDINRSQSTNDVFPSAIQVAAVKASEDKLLPALGGLMDSIGALEERYGDVVKTGRTHLQDAVPVSCGQEFSSWRKALEKAYMSMERAADGIRELPLGGTAVGTGLNAPQGYDEAVCRHLSRNEETEFRPAANKFTSMAFKDDISRFHSSLRALAEVLMKIANDVRWYASGPRCGIGEMTIPANEPGSSIMPGKVNPTQCEAMIMVCTEVMGNDVTVGMAAAQGNFQLNVFMPLIAFKVTESISILADAVGSFDENCVKGLKVVTARTEENLRRSLMLVTALNSQIGYDNAARIAHQAYEKNISLEDAAAELGLMDREKFRELTDPVKMI